MPLQPPNSRRALKHTRTVQIDAYARDDGLWDLEARITDVKTADIRLASGVRVAGTPLHDLALRVTVDSALTVVDAQASSDAVPYPGHCEQIAPDYRGLIGLNLMRGFRHQVKERLSGIQGCTHLTELAQILPTAAIQAFAGDVFDTGDAASDDGSKTEKPYQLDRCHALRSDGAAVARFYPRWAKHRLVT